MSELALLGTRYTTEGAQQALQTLDQYSAKAKTATQASDEVAGGSKRMSASMQQMVESIQRAEREMAEVTRHERAMAQAAEAAEASTRALGLAAGQASGSLTKIGKDAQVAANHFDHLYDTMKHDFAAQYAAQMGSVIHANDRVGASSKVLQQTTLNLSRQFADVGVQAAMGTNALMIAIMQGPQIADAFAQAKSQGLGFRDALAGITKGALSLLATWGPLIAAGGALVGAFVLWKKHTDDVKKALEQTEMATKDLATAQFEATEALGQAAEFADKYKVSAGALTKSLDDLLSSQNAAYRETLSGISATDEAGRAAVRRAELERLLTVNILRRAAAEAEARAQTSKDAAKTADRAAFGSGLIAAMGMAGNPEAIAMGQAVQAEKYRKLGGEAAEKAAKQEMEYAKALKASADELLRAELTIPKVDEKRTKGMSEAEKAAKRAATEAERAREATADYIRTLEEQLAAVGQTSNAVRRLAADREIELALQRGDLDSAARIKGLILETEKMEDLAKALEEVAEWRKAADTAAKATGPLMQIPRDVAFDEADRLEELTKAFEEALRRADEIRYSVDDIYYSIRNHDWLGAFAGLFRVLEQLRATLRSNADLATKIGAFGGLATGIGGMIGGRAGSAISGIGSGAAAGAQLGSIIPGIGTGLGAIAGGLLGGLSSLFGGNKEKERRRNAEALARAEAELDRVREVAAQKRDLEIQLMEATGNAAGALAARRQDELRALDASNRALQEAVWAAQDLAEARQKEVDAAQSLVDDAHSRLSEAYEREAGALQDYIDRFQSWSDSLSKFLKGLYTGPAAMLSPEEQYRAARAEFDRVSAAAASGDENAIRDLESVSQAYLDASKDYYASSKEYFRDLERVRSAVSATQNYAAAQVDVGQAQLTALNASVAGILNVNASVLSVRDALAAYQAAVQQLAAAQLAQKAANDNAAPGGGASQAPDWASYISKNTDVANEYLRNMNSAKGREYLASLGISSVQDFGRWHWETFGKAEGRTPFGAGGIMDRPITLGESGIGAEVGPEGILPLANVNGKMGVHAVGGGDEEEKALLRTLIAKQDAIIAELQADKVQRTAMAEEQAKQSKKMDDTLAQVGRGLRAA